MFFHRIFTPGLSINSYLLGDEKSKRCVAIDPTRHVVSFIMHAQNAGVDITDIVETHIHADYVSGAKELKHQLNEKPCIYSSGMGGEKWIPAYADVVVHQGTKINIGEIRLEAIHTPGHTPEHVMWVCFDESRSAQVPWFAFTGDCVFVGSIGRPDLLGNNEVSFLGGELYQTIFERLAPFPDFLEILPAHGEGSLCGKSLKSRATTTLGYERLFNPYFKKDDKEKWIKNVLKDLPTSPPAFQHIKKNNLFGPPLMKALQTKIWDSQTGPTFADLFLLDIRHPEVFASHHIQASLNIPLSQSFCQWACWMLPFDQSIGLIVEKSFVYAEIVDQLRVMGFDQDIWVIRLGEDEHEFPYPFTSFPMMEVEHLAQQHPDFTSLYVLDVRNKDEWCTGHILGTHHLELNDLENSLDYLPSNQSIALLCRSGQRASIAASLLQKKGFSSVVNIRGGMQAWMQAGLPIKIDDSKL